MMPRTPEPERHRQTLERAKDACSQMDTVVAALDGIIAQLEEQNRFAQRCDRVSFLQSSNITLFV